MAVANIVKTSLCPVGLDKMLVDDIGDVTITFFSCFCLKESLLVSHPQCCKATDDGSSTSAGRVFQALGDHLLRMKLSTTYEGERVCITALDPSSGYFFWTIKHTFSDAYLVSV
ncbi:unnamed protein product [Microthlaspi erraticum]|uniref:DUF7806 domain-containing protein n=1 Tax=Microthlaspi erraticum TaxID=1685480 RepID=A0A6D2I2H4_9BRAS|nr:unnamed protein product [Microthlaspi erraticum]